MPNNNDQNTEEQQETVKELQDLLQDQQNKLEAQRLSQDSKFQQKNTGVELSTITFFYPKLKLF